VEEGEACLAAAGRSLVSRSGTLGYRFDGFQTNTEGLTSELVSKKILPRGSGLELEPNSGLRFFASPNDGIRARIPEF
jgi:hypothetical protein